MTLREAAELVGGRVDPADQDKTIRSVGSLDESGEGDIAYYGSPKYLKALQKCRATAVFVPSGFDEELLAAKIWVDHPGAAFAALHAHFAPPPISYPPGIHPTAVVSPEATVGADVCIQAFAVVEPGAQIGDRTILGAHSYVGHEAVLGADCHLYPHVTVRDRCQIGKRVILHPGVVVGSDGFGYEFRDGKQQKIAQTGIVQIDDDVEIGANTTVDRARFGRTWIQVGAKLDNLVQIGHNVTVGKHTIICANVGISGSTRVGDNVILAGKVGVNGHIEIGDGTVVTAMAGITKSVPPKSVLVGLPAKPMSEYKANYVLLRNIRKLYDRVKKLEDGE